MESINKMPYKLICMACLASGNSTRIIIDKKLKRFYLDSLKENQPVYPKTKLCLRVCWECEVLLKKAVSFQEQVKNSHNILQLFSVEDLNEYLLTRSPRLGLKVNTPISIHPNERITKAWRLSSSTKELKDDLKVEWSDHGKGLTNLETLEHSIDLDDSVTELTVPVVSEGTDNDSLWENEYINAIGVEIEALVSKVKNKKRSRVSSKQKTVKKVAKKMRHRMKNLNECLSKDVTRTPRLSRKVNSPISTHPKDEIRNARKFRSSSSTELNDVLVVEWSDHEDCSSNLETQENNSNLINSLTDLTDPEQAGVTDEDSVSENEYKHAIEVELEALVNKKRSTMASKLMRSKTERSKKFDDQNILTIDLSYEEMLLERARESTRESYVNAEYKCDSCLMGFNYKKSFMAHQAAKHSSDRGECVCPICETVLPTVDSFTAHYKRHMRRYECGICQKRTMDIKVMQQHYYSTHEISLKEYKCNICGKISNSIDTHRYHKDTHKARVQCTECDKTFTQRVGLLNHRQAVHERNNAFPCTICDKVFRWKTSLRKHLDKHNVKDKSASAAYCSECGITFSSRGTYQRHMKNSLKHVTPEQLRYICDHCNRRFADKTKLRDHIEEKHLFKTYKCHICTKPFKNRVGMDQHIRNVHKRRPNDKICHYCGKAYSTTVQLESHLLAHTGERPFSCEYCPTTFTRNSNLYKHKKQVHLNI